MSSAKGVIKNGQVIASETEQDIFSALGFAYVEPEEREAINGEQAAEWNKEEQQTGGCKWRRLCI